MKFPEIKGTNLEGKKYTLPYELEGELNLVIIPFKRYQQELVDNWITKLEFIIKEYSNVRVFELPTLSRMYLPMRFIIDGGMRAGIPNKGVRERTITIYTKKSILKSKLSINSENFIYLYLMNKSGEIIWRTDGEINEEKIGKLKNILKRISSS